MRENKILDYVFAERVSRLLFLAKNEGPRTMNSLVESEIVHM